MLECVKSSESPRLWGKTHLTGKRDRDQQRGSHTGPLPGIFMHSRVAGCDLPAIAQAATVVFPPGLFVTILTPAQVSFVLINTVRRLVSFQVHVRPPPVL